MARLADLRQPADRDVARVAERYVLRESLLLFAGPLRDDEMWLPARVIDSREPTDAFDPARYDCHRRAGPEGAKVRKVRSQLLVAGSIGAEPEGIVGEDAAHRDECGGVGETGEGDRCDRTVRGVHWSRHEPAEAHHPLVVRCGDGRAALRRYSLRLARLRRASRSSLHRSEVCQVRRELLQRLHLELAHPLAREPKLAPDRLE
jgi:hypothetical protein